VRSARRAHVLAFHGADSEPLSEIFLEKEEHYHHGDGCQDGSAHDHPYVPWACGELEGL